MSWGMSSWGNFSWGGSGFAATDHIPIDGATDVARLTFISFKLFSQSGDVDLTSINLTANGVDLIINGIFTINAAGTIDDNIPNEVIVSLTINSPFPPNTLITLSLSAINTSLEPLTDGTTWSFTTDDQVTTFSTYILRQFGRVNRVA